MSGADAEQIGRVVKEGFLVKKGHFRTNWRTRWFQLRRDRLSYYKNRTDMQPIDSIMLEGCLVHRPREELVRHPHRFELKTSAGRSYFLEAASEAEVEAWTTAIAQGAQKQAALRRHVSVKQRSISVSQHLEGSATSKELLEAMQDVNAGIKLGTHSLRSGRECHRCFAGAQLIDWLVEWSFCETRAGACSLGLSMINGGFIRAVDDKLVDSENFVDSSGAFYQFVALHVSSRGGTLPFTPEESCPIKSLSPMALESDESDLDSSVEEDKGAMDESLQAMGLGPQPAATGSLHFEIKQGILVKRGHKRKNWKARRFMLMADALYYYRASKPQSDHIGRIPLKGARVQVSDDVKRSASESNLDSRSGPLFTVTTRDKVDYILQATDSTERSEWVTAVQKCIAHQAKTS